MTNTLLSISAIYPITYQHVMLAIIGALMYNLMRLDEAKKLGDGYSFKVWINKNWISLILSTLSIVSMFMLRGEIKDIAGFDMSNRLGCLLAGFTAHTFVSMIRSSARRRLANSNPEESKKI